MTSNGKYNQDDIFVPINIGPINATTFNISYILKSNDTIEV